MPDEADVLEPRTFRQRVGGRWAISWQGFIITASLGLLALLAGEQQAVASALLFLRWFALYAVAMGVTGGLVLLANGTVFRNRRARPLPSSLVIAFHGICGVLYSLLVSLGALRLGLEPDVTLVERVSINTLYAMWWGPTLSYFLDYREQVRNTRRRLIADAVDVQLTQAQQDELTRRMSDELIAEVNAELIPARDAIDSMLRRLDEVSTVPAGDSTDDWDAAARLLRGTAAASVRPLSRRIWRQSEVLRPRERWWTLPSNIVRHQPFRPLAFAVVDVLGTVAQQAHNFGVANALVLLGTGLTLTIALMVTGNALMRRHPKQHAWIFIGTLVALQLTVVLRTWLREAFVTGSAPVSWIVTQMLATVLVVFVTSAFGAWSDREAATLLNLRNTLRHEQLVTLARSEQVALIAREMAQLLHGAVQTRLIACAMVLERDGRKSGNATLNVALTQALDVLTDPMQPRELSGSMLDEVGRKVALWDGFCDFTVSITGADSQSASGAVVGRAVEEGISNALRHGRATRIDIQIDARDDGTVSIAIMDNGIGPQNGPPGLGSAYLQQATGGQWSITSIPDGARLSAVIHP